MTEPDTHLSTANADRILIVDDDPGIRELLSEFLAGHGYTVRTADGAARMREMLEERPFDLIVLDLMMPGEDGLSALRTLQFGDGPPVIMLSAYGTDVERIVGLEIGAEDFVQKPCNPRELLARIRTVLRRCRRREGGPAIERAEAMSPPGESSTGEPSTGEPPPGETERRIFRFAGWALDATSRVLFDPDGTIVNLSDGELRMLLAFVERPRRVLTRDQLLDFAFGADKEHFDRAVDVQISRLRRKMAGRIGSIDLIRTIRSEGYMFGPEVTR